MNDAFHAAASSMAAVQRLVEIATENVVHAQTPGYQRRMLATHSFETALDRELHRSPSMVATFEKTSFQNGAPVASASPLALALSGPGFLAVETPVGPAYTRNGDLTLSPDGTLTTRSGFAVMGEAGPLRANPAAGPVRIGDGGVLHQGGEEIGRLVLVEFENTDVLERIADTLFRAPEAAGARPAVATQAIAGMVELPQERAVAGMVHLISASREFETAQRVASVINQTYERLLSRQS